MRESSFAFPAQNRACVCISSQLYDRRALDTESPLPLFNSLTHLVYLTSTSPRIREIMTMDGGLERLVRILHDFCISPPPPENPQAIYGLSPPTARPQKLVPTLNPASWDKHAAYRFSLAFQCLVNIGVRGSEHIRSRVVQAGTLDVVGMILEAWLVSKGFAVGPSTSATGMPRETREQRAARRQATLESRQRDQAQAQAQALTAALQREARLEHIFRAERAATGAAALDTEDVQMTEGVPLRRRGSTATVIPSESSFTRTQPTSDPLSATSDAETSTDNSTATTPITAGTPTTGAVVIPMRERSGTIIARPSWDPTGEVLRGRNRRQNVPSTSNSTDNSRPETETEDDGDVDMDASITTHDTDTSPSPQSRARAFATPRRAVGIVSEPPANPAGPSIELNAEPHIIINPGEIGAGGVEDGIVSLEANDDFAMGAPPGAPGAIEDAPTIRGANASPGPTPPDVTPRAGPTTLPNAFNPPPPIPRPHGREPGMRIAGTSRVAGLRNTVQNADAIATATAVTGNNNNNNANDRHRHHHHHYPHESVETGPYRDEDVLLSLQLLAYLSKYPHVRQAFYKPRASFHPATANLQTQTLRTPTTSTAAASPAVGGPSRTNAAVPASKEPLAFFKHLSRGKEKEKAVGQQAGAVGSSVGGGVRHTNVFSLVERFTFKPSSSEVEMDGGPPVLPHEIQYWAGAIMRNACRKDDSRGGIRQCANMLCGKWETYPREFAKCRRCRKAKYCGKECQSTAWSEGHRFWCSAKEGEEGSGHGNAGEDGGERHSRGGSTVTGDASTARAERRAERERERQARAAAMGIDTNQVTRAVANAFRSTAVNRDMMNPNAAGPTATPEPIGGRPPWNVNYDLVRRRREEGRRRAETVGTIGDARVPPPLPPRHLGVEEDASMMDDTAAVVSVDDDMVLG